MDMKTIFHIPIYSMAKNVFDKRWNRKKDALMASFIEHGHKEKDAIVAIDRLTLPQRLWKYNQIIGYIVISMSHSDIWFDLFCTFDKKFYADSKSKHFIQDWSLSGCHFRVKDSYTNEDIKNEIHDWLLSIKNGHLNDKYYVDMETFDVLGEFINFRGLQDTFRQG